MMEWIFDLSTLYWIKCSIKNSRIAHDYLKIDDYNYCFDSIKVNSSTYWVIIRFRDSYEINFDVATIIASYEVHS